MKIIEIPRLEAPERTQFHEEYLIPRRPVIITNAIDKWKALNLWSPQYFKEEFGYLQVPLRVTDDEIAYFKKYSTSDEMSTSTLADYIDTIKTWSDAGKRPPYVGNIPLGDSAVRKNVTQLFDHFKFPKYLNSDNEEFRVWIAAVGQRSTIHNDPFHNLNAQVCGSKRWLLMAPEEHENIYAQKQHDGLWWSPIDPQDPDFETYPLYNNVELWTGDVRPGDLLFVPIYWWHQAFSLELSININSWGAGVFQPYQPLVTQG